MSETVVRINSELEAGLVAEAPSYALGAVRETDEVYTLDLLGTDIYMSTGAIKAPQHQLEHSFFSLSTRNSPKSSKYVHNDVTINIDCPVGVPNTKDSDVIVFLTSKAMLVQSKSRKQDGTEITPRRISFSPREFLEFTERGFGSNSYQSLYRSCNRLFNTQVETNLETGGQITKGRWRFISGIEYIYTDPHGKEVVRDQYLVDGDSEGRNYLLERIVIELSDWFWRIIKDKQVLSLSSKYFEINTYLARRIYEIGRKHAGRQRNFSISFTKLKRKCRSIDTDTKFRHRLSKIVKDQSIPEYTLTLTKKEPKSPNSECLIFSARPDEIVKIPEKFDKRAQRRKKKARSQLSPSTVEGLAAFYAVEQYVIYGAEADYRSHMKDEGKEIKNMDIELTVWLQSVLKQ